MCVCSSWAERAKRAERRNVCVCAPGGAKKRVCVCSSWAERKRLCVRAGRWERSKHWGVVCVCVFVFHLPQIKDWNVWYWHTRTVFVCGVFARGVCVCVHLRSCRACSPPTRTHEYPFSDSTLSNAEKHHLRRPGCSPPPLCSRLGHAGSRPAQTNDLARPACPRCGTHTHSIFLIISHIM
jgi:hypothetical protein